MTVDRTAPDRVARDLETDVNGLARYVAERYVGPSPLPPVAVVTATPRKLGWFDLKQIMEPVATLENTSSMTGVWRHPSGDVATLIHGVGGPSADRLLLTAMMQGVRAFIRIGTCGLISPGARIGTVIVAEAATSDDTAFGWYVAHARRSQPLVDGRFFAAHDGLLDTAEQALAPQIKAGWAYRGRVFSTSLIFREGPAAVAEYQRLGCLAADMECGTVLACASRYGVPALGLLVGRDHIVEGGFHTEQPEQFEGGVAAIRRALDQLIPVAQRAAGTLE